MAELRRILPYARRHARGYATSLAVLLAGSLLSMAVPLLLRAAVDRLGAGITRTDLALACCAVVGLTVLRGFASFYGRRRIVLIARDIEYEIRNDLFRRLQALGPDFHARHPPGDLSSRIVNDLDGIRMLIGVGVMVFCSTSLTALLGMAMMFWLDAALAAAALAPLAGIAAAFALTHTALERRSAAVQEQLGVLSARAQENFSGQRTVRIYGIEDEEVERFDAASLEYMRRQMSLVRLRGVLWASLAFLAEAGIALTLWIGGRGILAGTFTKGDLVAFTAYQFMLVWPMIALGWFVGLFQRGHACARRIGEILDAPVEAPAGTAAADGRAAPRIEIRDLTFSFGGEPVLAHIRMEIPAGGFVAIVGRTGAGKSTLVRLITRQIDPPRGTIFVDGRDVLDIPAAELRARMAVVPQEDFLFRETIRWNIAFGATDGAGPERVQAAADIAHFHRDVEGFPKRYDEVVGEGGVTLSGGQRQRACVARAVIRDAGLLILDDCFSAVDPATEREILNRLGTAFAARTRILVTHRLAGCTVADCIYVLDGGRLVEQGRHEDLLATGGLYARLWAQQRWTAEGAA